MQSSISSRSRSSGASAAQVTSVTIRRSCSSSVAASSRRWRAVQPSWPAQRGMARTASGARPARAARVTCWAHSYRERQLQAVRSTTSSTSPRGSSLRSSRTPANGSHQRNSRRWRARVVSTRGRSPRVTSAATDETSHATDPRALVGTGATLTPGRPDRPGRSLTTAPPFSAFDDATCRRGTCRGLGPARDGPSDSGCTRRILRRWGEQADTSGEGKAVPNSWLTLERSPDGSRAPHVARLESVGRCLPATRLTTEELMASTRHRTSIDLERLTGIHERRVSDGRHNSLTLAVAAATDCLSRSQHRPEDLEVVVSCSITKYREDLVQWIEPPMSVAVAQSIGAADAVTFDLANACAGMLPGVFVLANQIRRGEVRRGMVVSGEYISRLSVNAAAHVRSVLSRELASLTLGDAGAAVIIERAPEGTSGIDVAGFTTVSQHSELCFAYPARHARGGRMFTKARALHQAAIA